MKEIAADLTGLGDLADLLTDALLEDPSNTLREGGFIADGFDVELDRLRGVGRDGRSWLAEFQKREIERTGHGRLATGRFVNTIVQQHVNEIRRALHLRLTSHREREEEPEDRSPGRSEERITTEGLDSDGGHR